MKIEVKNVTKRFKDSVILDDVNLEFVGGKIYGLIGRNGSGKSVLLKMLCAFYEPSSGEILYDGENIIKEEKYPPSTRALIEKPAFIPDLTGKQNLLLLASIQNIIGEKEIDSTMQRLGLVPNDNKKYYKYSFSLQIGIPRVFALSYLLPGFSPTITTLVLEETLSIHFPPFVTIISFATSRVSS